MRKSLWRWWLLLSGGVAIGLVVLALYWRANPQCAAVFGDDLLPRGGFARDADQDMFPDGWDALVKGPIRLAAQGDFTVTGSGRSIQVIGIANALFTPRVSVQPARSYCVVAQALADQAPAPTRMRFQFHWFDASGAEVAQDVTDWQVVKTPAGGGWSVLRGAFRAPGTATGLRVSFHPASDDRIYLDQISLRRGGAGLFDGQRAFESMPAQAAITLSPWPYGRRAALSFSFDWETAMGGLIHSRSVEDLYSDQDPLVRGLRMRQGITETLAIFRPYGIRATYYATGYNFLTGNREATMFMGNPTYAWATPANRWRSDWSHRAWFSHDPFTDYHDQARVGAAWYFGDLISVLINAGQDIQSHTFSHFYGGFVSPDDWRADFDAWRGVAAAQGHAPARSLAFPWSSSGGMSYAGWDVFVANGVTSVTRLSHQPQYRLFAYQDDVPIRPRCMPLPGHETILACPDIYLTPGVREEKVLRAIDEVLASGGALDVWAHTEEVITPQQLATWRRVVAAAARNPDLWIAPLAEIADWQQAIAAVQVSRITPTIVPDALAQVYQVTLRNQSAQRLQGVTLRFPFAVARVTSLDQPSGDQQPLVDGHEVVVTLAAEHAITLEVVPLMAR